MHAARPSLLLMKARKGAGVGQGGTPSLICSDPKNARTFAQTVGQWGRHKHTHTHSLASMSKDQSLHFHIITCLWDNMQAEFRLIPPHTTDAPSIPCFGWCVRYPLAVGVRGEKAVTNHRYTQTRSRTPTPLLAGFNPLLHPISIPTHLHSNSQLSQARGLTIL